MTRRRRRSPSDRTPGFELGAGADVSLLGLVSLSPQVRYIGQNLKLKVPGVSSPTTSSQGFNYFTFDVASLLSLAARSKTASRFDSPTSGQGCRHENHCTDTRHRLPAAPRRLQGHGARRRHADEHDRVPHARLDAAVHHEGAHGAEGAGAVRKPELENDGGRDRARLQRRGLEEGHPRISRVSKGQILFALLSDKTGASTDLAILP